MKRIYFGSRDFRPTAPGYLLNISNVLQLAESRQLVLRNDMSGVGRSNQDAASDFIH